MKEGNTSADMIDPIIDAFDEVDLDNVEDP